MSQSNLLQIKGIRDGLLITLGSAPWKDLSTALFAQIESQQAFFSGARVALEVGPQPLHVNELAALRDALSEQGITLWAVVSDSPLTQSTAQMLGLATRLSKPKPEAVRPAPPPETPREDAALWVQKTLRSGVRVEFPGHVVVLGDVNAGAEIVAGGSVVVWGRLRGVVHAGAQGKREAVVCALDLSPTQLRIAEEIAITPKRQGKPMPEVVKIKDGRLQAEPWQAD
jgi:septum site-determining protein MinC